MATFVFREELEQASLEGRLRKLMKIHRVMNLDGLCRESGCSRDEIRSILNTLMQRREVERLRPVNYEKDDMDFFLLCSLPRTASSATWQRGRQHNWNRWIENAKRAIRAPVLGRRQNAYS